MKAAQATKDFAGYLDHLFGEESAHETGDAHPNRAALPTAGIPQQNGRVPRTVDALKKADASNPTPRKRVAKSEPTSDAQTSNGLGQIIPASAGEEAATVLMAPGTSVLASSTIPRKREGDALRDHGAQNTPDRPPTISKTPRKRAGNAGHLEHGTQPHLADVSEPTPRKRVTKVRKTHEAHHDLDLGQTIPASPGGGDHSRNDPHTFAVTPEISLIIALWRQRQDLRRAESRLNLQCQAIIRSNLGGDKEAAGKAWALVKKGVCEDTNLLLVLTPFRQAMASLDDTADGIEKQLRKLAKAMPLWTTWGQDVRGMGELSFAGFLGEAGRPLTDYRTVSCLWKRFGLAVIGGERQRRVKDAELALAHGYSAQRRSYAYVMATGLMRQQGDSGPYRVIYDNRKCMEAGAVATPGHAHNRALRYMTKELLKRAWIAARALEMPEGQMENDAQISSAHPPATHPAKVGEITKVEATTNHAL